MKKKHTYISLDLKSFYASVECIERGLNPLTTHLVVADSSRTEKTICLAVSPSLKAYGISGRARLFEVVQRVNEVNRERRRMNMGRALTGKSHFVEELSVHPDWALDYVVAPPRMGHYIEFSTRIYSVYLRYVSSDDIHVYSIDEVFIDVTNYLQLYKMSAHELAKQMILYVLNETGITATAGIGTNLYLCKVAMDIVAKHLPADKDGVRIAELDEMSYRRTLWNHRPITDFWRLGKGYARKLEEYGIYTMGALARFSLQHEDFLYKQFGVHAELLIDHAWGWEPCTLDVIKAYRPETNSFSSGQVLSCAYTVAKARVVVKEMADAAALQLVERGMTTDQLVLTVGYDVENLISVERKDGYHGEITTDFYGRKVPKHAHGTANLSSRTSSSRRISKAVVELFDRIVNPDLLVRRLTLTTNHVLRVHDEDKKKHEPQQLDLFADYEIQERQRREEELELQREHSMQETLVAIKKRFGKNAILKGTSYLDGATAKDRNEQIGGHKA